MVVGEGGGRGDFAHGVWEWKVPQYSGGAKQYEIGAERQPCQSVKLFSSDLRGKRPRWRSTATHSGNRRCRKVGWEHP
jgi:hypothetical protein